MDHRYQVFVSHPSFPFTESWLGVLVSVMTMAGPSTFVHGQNPVAFFYNVPSTRGTASRCGPIDYWPSFLLMSEARKGFKIHLLLEGW